MVYHPSLITLDNIEKLPAAEKGRVYMLSFLITSPFPYYSGLWKIEIEISAYLLI